MAAITVNISLTLYERVRDLVNGGMYASPEQFLEIAAFNQLALEEGSTPEELRKRNHRKPPEARTSNRSREAKKKIPKKSRGRQHRIVVGVGGDRHSRRTPSEVEVSRLFSRLTDLNSDLPLPQIFRSSVRPPTERLWGQVNRLFPLKFICRWLAITNRGQTSWERYDGMSERLSADAAMLGSVLDRDDRNAGRKRDEMLATGLPRGGNIASVDRFLSQFVARTTRTFEIYPGAICQYALADFDGDRLVLTDRGLELAGLPNPILDHDHSRAGASLADEERSYFVYQVLHYVPGELSDLRLVLGAILRGSQTPDELFETAGAQLPTTWSDVMVRTHLSGVIARLTDMGLLRRRWQGRHVNYETASLAESLMPHSDGSRI